MGREPARWSNRDKLSSWAATEDVAEDATWYDVRTITLDAAEDATEDDSWRIIKHGVRDVAWDFIESTVDNVTGDATWAVLAR